ncbi:hypothetical protein B0T10DRAFT_563798 [Thelonectria olida]|uniref:Uncharacterized protein n=1 Tax=Thelonectria olida TaxID=1576542 RepID=A0A9P9AQ80_9HYPO|nr:hypothetical protein B0T10DRAFT_563798 [Thelonectria olida]
MGVSRSSCSEMWGLEENSRGWRIWLIFAVLLGFVVNFIAVLGCLSDATSSIHLYKVGQTDLLAAIEVVTNRSAESFQNPALPDTWYWGLSGVCDSNHHCEKDFPPTYSLGGIVENSLKAELADNKAAYTAAIAPWASVIRTDAIDGSSKTKNRRLHDDRQNFVSFNKASAAMAVLALLTSASVLITALATASSRKVPLWALYFGTFVDGMFLLASLILAIYAMNYGPRSLMRAAEGAGVAAVPELKDPGRYLGPGMYTLAAGVMVKFLAIAGVFIGFIVFGFISLLSSRAKFDLLAANLRGMQPPQLPP